MHACAHNNNNNHNREWYVCRHKLRYWRRWATAVGRGPGRRHGVVQAVHDGQQARKPRGNLGIQGVVGRRLQGFDLFPQLRHHAVRVRQLARFGKQRRLKGGFVGNFVLQAVQLCGERLLFCSGYRQDILRVCRHGCVHACTARVVLLLQ